VPSEKPVALISYLDVVLVLLAAPIMIAIGVSVAGYAIGGGAWIVLRAVGEVVDRILVDRDGGRASGAGDAARGARTEISLRLGYMLGRLFLLALAVVLARSGSGRDAGLTALVLIGFAFTVQLSTSALGRPRRRS
jgi:hypothetical protein